MPKNTHVYVADLLNTMTSLTKNRQ